MENGILKLIVANVADDLWIGGSDADRKAFVDKISSFYEIGTPVHCSAVTLPTVRLFAVVAGLRSPPLTRGSHVYCA